jgi:hypothetical protein
MARETWTVDGFDLTAGAAGNMDVEYRGGLLVTPAPVGENPSVPNRTGEIWRRKVHGPGAFVLNMWVGGTGSTAQTTAQAKYDDVLRATHHVHRLPRYVRGLPDGSQRECLGEVQSAVAPANIGQQGYRFSIEVKVPGGYWQDTADATDTLAGSSSTSRDLTLTNLGGGTAPMEALRYIIGGNCTNPRVIDRTDGVDGDWFRYNGNVPAGATLTVNAATWQVTATGFTPNPAALEFTGYRYLSIPAATPGNTQTVRFTCTSPSGASLNVTGRRTWLV